MGTAALGGEPRHNGRQQVRAAEQDDRSAREARRSERALTQAVVALRPIEDVDLDALFDQMRDHASVWMAGFSAEHPDDKNAFKVHMAKQRNSPDITLRAITCDGQLVGCMGSFAFQGQTEVTYWLDRAVWGHGIASRALALLLDLVPTRPLYARVASDNIGSLRAAQRAGFKIIGTEMSFALVRNSQIEQTILRKD